MLTLQGRNPPGKDRINARKHVGDAAGFHYPYYDGLDNLPPLWLNNLNNGNDQRAFKAIVLVSNSNYTSVVISSLKTRKEYLS